MKVSIITAVRNGAAAIARTINAVNDQSYPNIEHIFVDGASTDRTVDEIRKSARRDCRLVSERDMGVYDAFAKGCRMASGDVIAYLNAGDFYSDDGVIRRVMERFDSSRADIVFGNVTVVDQVDTAKVVRHYRSSWFNPRMIAYGFMPAHPTLFIRRGVYEKFGSYDTSYRIAGDFELVARLFARGAVSYSFIDETLVRMPRGGLSTSGFRSNWIITQEMKRACDSNGIRTNYFKLALRFPIKMTEWFSGEARASERSPK